MNRFLVFVSVVMLILLTILSCSSGVPVQADETNLNVIEKAIQTLKEKKIPETDEAMLILKRYRFYLSELEKGNAYMDWRADKTPPIYNPTIFMRLMDQTNIERIVTNATKGKDAFAGITGFFERAYISDVDNTIDSYTIYIPHTFNPKKNYPVVVMLHGFGGSTYIDPYSPAHFGFLKACEQREIIMVAPCGRHKLPEHRGFYIADAEIDVLQVLSLVKKFYPVDEKRVYLTGNSMGGFGSYWIASRNTDLFAATAPVCGIWSGIMGYPRVDLDALKNMPVFLFHNDLDKTVPVSESRTAYEYLKEIGAEVYYQEYQVDKQDLWEYGIYGGHNAWDSAYEGTTLIDWFLGYTK